MVIGDCNCMSRITAIFALLVSSCWAADKPDLTSARDLYKVECADCHGTKGQGSAETRVPAVAGLHPFYVLRQLRNFQGQRRAVDPSNPRAEHMHLEALSMDDKTMKSVAEVIASMRPNKPIDDDAWGDPKRGATLFAQHCAQCHGAAAEGNLTKQAPALHGFQSWYLVEQIKLLQKGVRQPDVNVAEAVAMHQMIAKMPLESDILDIAAFASSRLAEAKKED